MLHFSMSSPVKLGCGSWECRCDQKHSVPFKVRGKGGSVTIEILPAPRGLGLVAGGKIRNLLRLAGYKRCMDYCKGLYHYNEFYIKSGITMS